jgi:hypothetical protein
MTAGDHVGTLQTSAFASHTHIVAARIASVGSGTGAANLLTSTDNSFSTDATGGSETRPVNMYRMMIIKY